MKKITLYVCLSLLVAGVFAQTMDIAPSINYQNAASLKAKSSSWTAQLSIPISSNIWKSATYGIEADSNYLYVTKFNSNKFFRLTKTGALVDSFSVTGTPSLPASSGIRDLAYDGQYFYGGTYSNVIYKMDFTAHTIVSAITLPTGFNVRHISYDPTADGGAGGLWVGPWNTFGPRLYSMSGTLLDSIPKANLGATIAGSAYDNVSPGGPYLWLYSQTSTNMNDIIQVNIATKQKTGLIHDMAADFPAIVPALAGGLFQMTDFINGTTTLGGLAQGSYIWGVDLTSTFPPLQSTEIISLNLAGYVLVNAPQTIGGTLQNFGSTPITSMVLNYSIDGAAPVTQNITGLNIATYGTYNYSHSTQWTPPSMASYTVKLWASNINADPAYLSDTITKVVNTATQSTVRKPCFEEFTSSTCAPCATFNSTTFTPFITAHPGEFSLIKYQMNWPTPGDPYYTAEGGDRKTYYDVTGVPTLFIDGVEATKTTTYLTSTLTAEKSKPTFFTISGVTPTYSGTNISVPVTITPYVNGTFKVYVVIVEKTTTGNVGNNGETSFKHVMMKMLPDGAGTSVNFTAGTAYTNTFTQNLSGTHVEEMTDLMAVVFIQDVNSKEIFQSIENDITTGIDNNTTNNFTVFPNPAKDFVTIQNASNSDLKVYDIYGKMIISVNDISGNYRLDITSLPNSTYLLQIVNADKITTRKFTVLK